MKKTVFWLAASAFVMFALPWLAVSFVRGDAGMAVCFLLFFAVDPLYSVVLGAFAGRDAGTRWSLPLLSALFFLAGTWLFFDRRETAFLLYAAAYLVLGAAAMLISALVNRRRGGRHA